MKRLKNKREEEKKNNNNNTEIYIPLELSDVCNFSFFVVVGIFGRFLAASFVLLCNGSVN